MENKTYFAMVHANESGGYWCEFPDLPSCMTQGKDMEELERMASDLLDTWRTMALEQNEDMPEPSGREAVEEKAKTCVVPVCGIIGVVC